jgi:hypothetical protein
MSDDTIYPKRGRKAFDALRAAGATTMRTTSNGDQAWDFADGRNACVVATSGALYVRKAGREIALAVAPNITRSWPDGGVAYHVGVSTPGVGGGGHRVEASRISCASCGMQAQLNHDGTCALCGAALPC